MAAACHSNLLLPETCSRTNIACIQWHQVQIGPLGVEVTKVEMNGSLSHTSTCLRGVDEQLYHQSHTNFLNHWLQ
jgi:hypothetical protein